MHQTASLENAPAPSREDDTPPPPTSPEPPYVTNLFGPESEDRPLPPLVNDLVTEIVGLADAHPTTVAAVALATLMAVLGPKVKLRRGRSQHALGFNLIVSHRTPRTLPWFDAVAAPFVGRVFDMQRAVCRDGQKKMSEAIARQREEFARVCKTHAPNDALVARLRAELDRAPAGLKPNVASSSVVPKDLARMLADCFDGGMTLAALGNDPGADLLRLKVPERAQLAEALNRSWDGLPLTLGRAVHEGYLSVLWQTREPSKALFGPRGFQPGFLPVPCLLFSDDSTGERVGTFSCEANWKKICDEIFNIRCLDRQTIFSFHAEAETALAEFGKQIAANLDPVPAELRGAVSWMPDLAARLAALFWVLAARNETVVEKPAVVEAIKATGWFGRQHLMAAVAATAATDTADNADRKPMLLAKIRAKGPITRRDLRRSFDNQRTCWFDAALETLIAEKLVCYDGSGRLAMHT